MESLEQQEILNDYQHAFDALAELKSDKYHKAMADLAEDIDRLEKEADGY